MFKHINSILERPPVYTKTETAFWNDEYISKQMLKAHLNPDFDGASRKSVFIQQSAVWINQIVPPAAYPFLLDIGCGPGLYAERFADAGYQVTGIDFSQRSIEYAQNSALKKGVKINYYNQDYLTLKLNGVYDFAVMIYCDYGALSTADRQILMRNVYQHLKCGGKFLLDVFSMAYYNGFHEKQTWDICCNGGFWREDEYLELNRCCRYPDNVTLEQTSIISNCGAVTYYLWNTCFSIDMLIGEAAEVGFKVCGVFGDVAGKGYEDDHLTIAVLLEK